MHTSGQTEDISQGPVPSFHCGFRRLNSCPQTCKVTSFMLVTQLPGRLSGSPFCLVDPPVK